MITETTSNEIVLTLTGLAAGAGLAAAAVWLERRPRVDFKPRLVPTTPMLFAGLMIVVLAAVHILNLYGVHTGR